MRLRISVCLEEGCPELVSGGGRCAVHARERARRIERENGYRENGWRWVYNDPRWRALRRQVKREQPWCGVEWCDYPTTDADHRLALRDGGPPFERANVWGLCKRHHSQKTAAEVRGETWVPA